MAGDSASRGFEQKSMVVRPNDREVFHQPLYDRKNLSTSLTGDVAFFTNPIGSAETLVRYETAASITKTKRDTNLPGNGQDASKDYSVFGLSVAFIPAARTVKDTATTDGIRRDKDNIREGGWLNFKIVDKNICDIPLILIPELNGESGASSTRYGVSIYAGPSFAAPMWSFGEPIQIPKATNFSVVCKWDGTITLSQSFDMYVIFFAKVRRPT